MKKTIIFILIILSFNSCITNTQAFISKRQEFINYSNQFYINNIIYKPNTLIDLYHNDIKDILISIASNNKITINNSKQDKNTIGLEFIISETKNSNSLTDIYSLLIIINFYQHDILISQLHYNEESSKSISSIKYLYSIFNKIFSILSSDIKKAKLIYKGDF